MTTIELKNNFHHLIDSIENENLIPHDEMKIKYSKWL